MSKTLYAIALGALLVTGCGQASLTGAPQTAQGGMAARSQPASVEKDLKKLFALIDKNNDGKLTYAECLNGPSVAAPTRREREQNARKFMADFDRDKDGFVTRDEFFAAPHGAVVPPAAPAKGGQGVIIPPAAPAKGGQGVITPPPAPAQGPNGVITPPPAPDWGPMDLLFGTLDKNGDGRITHQELMSVEWSAGVTPAEKEQRARQFLADYDRDRDGAVSRSEFPDTPQGVKVNPTQP